MAVILLIFAVLIGFGIYASAKKAKALEAAKQDYLDSLSELKKAPTDADLKQQTLALGRVYSNLSRDKKGNTLFDEVALMNDINAACAAANVHPIPTTAAPAAVSVETRLQTLFSLKEKGLIEHSEYEKRRTEILSSI